MDLGVLQNWEEPTKEKTTEFKVYVYFPFIPDVSLSCLIG